MSKILLVRLDDFAEDYRRSENSLRLSPSLAVARLDRLYYYLQVMRAIYVTPATETSRFHVPLVMQGSVALLTLGVFFVGLYPQPLFDITDSVSAVLFAS